MVLNTSYFCTNIWVKDEELVFGGESVMFGAIGDGARNMPGSLLPLVRTRSGVVGCLFCVF